MDSGRLQPALLAGAFIGVLSALPFISAGNCCCCLWVLGGGVLAVYLRQQNQPVVVDAAEGMLMGLLAGAIGAVICTVLSIPVNMVMGPMQAEWMSRMAGNDDMPPEVREMMQRFAMGSGVVLTGLFNLVVFSVFGLLGGLLGVAIFKKNTPPPPPSAPYVPPPAPQPPTIVPHDPGTAH